MIKGVSRSELEIIQSILRPYAQNYEFFFFGSRVRGNFLKSSDLDVLIKGHEEMPLNDLESIKEQFDESSLPYIVNFIDYHKIDQNFYKLIAKDLNSVF